MWAHLTHKHPGVNPKTGAAKPVSQKQSTLTSFVGNSQPMSTSQQDTITKDLALMCAMDLKPISMVEGRGFRRFCNSLNPRYRIPCRKTVNHHLTSLYELEKKKLVDKLGKKHVALTSDLWTSNSLQGYITLTGHFVSPDWELFSHVLGTRLVVERHTGSNIAKEVTKLTREFNIEAVPSLTTDNASNMSLAAKEFNFFQVGCFAHTLQLAIEDGLKLPQISKTLGSSPQVSRPF